MMQYNKQYLDYHRQYMLSLKDISAVIEQWTSVVADYKVGKMSSIEYNNRIRALKTLFRQMRETERQHLKWFNAGQVK